MDDPGRQRRHNYPLSQNAPSAPRFTSHPGGGSSPERYRPTAVIPSTQPQTQTPRSATSYGSYYPDSAPGLASANMASSGLGPYGADYGQDERQQSQSLGGYNPAAVMYNVAQPGAQNPVYDAQQFGSRQSAAAMQMMSDVTSTYFGAETGNASATSLHPHTAHQGPGSSAGIYQQNPGLDYAGGIPGVPSVQQIGQGGADVSMAESTEYSDGALEEKWHSFQQGLAAVFQDISSGSLESASETLLTISKWLLPQVADLGLTADDASLHGDRIKLWDDFNHAWLALGQRQMDMMESGTPLSGSQSLLAQEKIEKLGDEIVRLCDGLERHGLVDYQYGVWEDRIVAIFEDCLGLFEEEDDDERSTTRR